jgi:hypothetical protein
LTVVLSKPIVIVSSLTVVVRPVSPTNVKVLPVLNVSLSPTSTDNIKLVDIAYVSADVILPC